MEMCIICGKEIKDDHVYCLDCYMKLDKSNAIKKCKDYYLNKNGNIVNVYDNYNNSLKYFPSIECFEKFINITNFTDFKIKRKPSVASDRVLEVLNENKCFLDSLNLKMEYSSLSHIDSLWMLSETFKLVDDINIKINTSIYMEYLIPNLEMERIDYILVYHNKMIFIEFGQSDVVSLRELSDEKTKQLNNYVKAMKKEFPSLKPKNIIKEIFVYKTDEKSVRQSIEHLAKMINIHFVEKMPKELLNGLR